MRSWVVVVAVCLGCGDNFVPIAPPLAHADTLFVVGHPDDDMIFMQPALSNALASRSVTTVYATTADRHGVDRHLFESTLVAYGAIVGSSNWECGSLDLGVGTVDHCRLRDRPVSLVNLDLQDGGIPGDRHDSLLHLVDGTVATMPLDGPVDGSVTMSSVLDMFEAVIAASSPEEIHTLELAGTHGRDHSSHMFVASFTLWASARVGFSGPVTWHRGYNVDAEVPTLAGAELAAATTMLGYYEGCAGHRAPCGYPADHVLPAHAIWLARQYASTRVRSATGVLALGDRCLLDSLTLGDCADALPVELTDTGALQLGAQCVGSTADGGLALGPCTDDPGQYWVLDSEGFVWNGRPPARGPDMKFDHMRCLNDGGAPTCGSQLQPRWQIR